MISTTRSLFFLLLISSTALLARNNAPKNYGDDSSPGLSDSWFEADYMPRLEKIARAYGKFSHQTKGLASLNFGVLVHNKYHHIYRSKALGDSGTEELFTHLLVNQLPLPTRVIFINKDGFKKKIWAKIPYVTHFIRGTDNFAMQEHRLFNPNGRFPEVEFWHPLNLNVYLHGHNPLEDVDSYPALSYVDREAAAEFSLSSQQQITASKQNFYTILEMILNHEGGVLFHCTGGVHRTGMVSMAIRKLQGGQWTKPFAEPIRIVSYSNLSSGQVIYLDNLAEVEYVMHNHHNVRLENFEAVRALAEEPEFQLLYQRYHQQLNTQ